MVPPVLVEACHLLLDAVQAGFDGHASSQVWLAGRHTEQRNPTATQCLRHINHFIKTYIGVQKQFKTKHCYALECLKQKRK